ncbi:sensor histidine kinase [Maribacter sp. 2307ULW6-5]|uniref:sensor histidine kinase n=1 Tax=Maribacter sp. 2307ULW6-5 TaxID=3386275 RepID=UPI0039BC929D
MDWNSQNPYKKVFVDTDDFDASYLDELEKNLEWINVDTTRFSMLNDLAYYWHTRNLTKAMQFTEKGLRLALKKKNSLWEGRFQITQGAVLLRMEALDSAQTVLALAQGKVQPSDLPLLYTQMGYVYERRGQLGKAADYALKALELGKEMDDLKAMAVAYSDLANLFWKQSKFKAGLEYGLRSLELFERRGITDLDHDFTLYVVGNNYLALRRYEEARSYYEQAVTIGERYGFYNNLSDIYISLVELHAFLGEYGEASRAGKKAVAYAELLDNAFMLMRSFLAVGKMHNAQENSTEAIKSLEKCIAVATENFGDAYFLSEAYRELAEAHARAQAYGKAYVAFSEYDTLKRQVFTAEADQRISKLRTEYDLVKKEGTILLQETQIKKQRALQNLGTAVTVLLLLLLALAYKAITNNKKKNRLLEKQNDEKEFLLKEIHHRVKNNLEIVSSLLSLQTAQMDDPNVLNAMAQSQHRVQSMGMIHQKLYMGKNLAAVEMKDYFEGLLEYILHSFGKQERIGVDLRMKELELDVDKAIPIGLIVNELVTNSMKYAFPNDRRGVIFLALERKADLLVLTVKDNGVGMAGTGTLPSTGFGTRLVRLLVRQLDGKLELRSDRGMAFHIKFQLSKAA